MSRLWVVAAVIAQGCVIVAPGTVDSFRRNGLDRAAFEMNCPKAEILLVQLPQNSVGVRGCSKKLVYVEVRGAGGYQWILNSSSEELATHK